MNEGNCTLYSASSFFFNAQFGSHPTHSCSVFLFSSLSSAQLPYTPYHKYFEPDFELHIKPSHVTENLNTAAHIDEVIEKLFRQLNEIEAVRCSLLLFSFCCVFLPHLFFFFPFSRSRDHRSPARRSRAATRRRRRRSSSAAAAPQTSGRTRGGSAARAAATTRRRASALRGQRARLRATRAARVAPRWPLPHLRPRFDHHRMRPTSGEGGERAREREREKDEEEEEEEEKRDDRALHIPSGTTV